MTPDGAPALPPLSATGRIDRLRERMAADDVAAVLVTHGPNVRWLTGFSGSNGSVLVRPGSAVLFTDSRYRTQAGHEMESAGVGDVDVHITRELVEADRIGDRLGIEAGRLTIRQGRDLAARFDGTELVDIDGVIEAFRQVKDNAEIARLRAAAAMADAAFEDVWPLLADGPGSVTEKEIAAALDHGMRRRGSDGVSFETIVASGPNGSLPHARPGERVIADGDLVVMDFGARVDGYGSDMTRTVVAGRGPVEPARAHLHAAVTQAQAAGVDGVAAGRSEASIDRRCRDALAGWDVSPLRGPGPGQEASAAADILGGLASLDDAFTHGTGHGIGLEIHEQPLLSSRADGILQAGQVITVEPGVYLPGYGGVRVEDSVVVTETGCEPITLSPKSLRPWSD